MPALPPFSPLAVTLALSALVFLTSWSATALRRWLRFRRRRHLPAQAGAAALAFGATLAGERRAAMQTTLVAVCGALTALFTSPAPEFVQIESVDSLSAVGLCILVSACLTIVLRRWPRERKAASDVLARHSTGARLETIRLPSQRIFHDVIPGAGGSIAHVLTAASGIYAVFTLADRFDGTGAFLRDRNTLALPASRAAINLHEIRSRTAQLQHWLQAESGVASRVRTVLVVRAWQSATVGPNDMLIVTPRDAVMLKGWKDPSTALMDDELDKIQQVLEQARVPHFTHWAAYRRDATVRTLPRQEVSSGSATEANA
ncbi:MAG: hypothetical protein AAFR91_03520 [Pseudomonadota bacterium]